MLSRTAGRTIYFSTLRGYIFIVMFRLFVVHGTGENFGGRVHGLRTPLLWFGEFDEVLPVGHGGNDVEWLRHLPRSIGLQQFC